MIDRPSLEEIRSQEVVDAIDSVVDNSYGARLEALQAEANDGEAALIADPVESQAWYVNFPRSFLSENGFRATNRREIAGFVLKWTAWMDSAEGTRSDIEPPVLLAADKHHSTGVTPADVVSRTDDDVREPSAEHAPEVAESIEAAFDLEDDF